MGVDDRPPPSPAARAARAYHERSKHHPGRFARSLGFLDWASQPDPYRRWEGAPTLALPRPDWDPAVGRTAEAPPARAGELPPGAWRVRPPGEARWPRGDYDALFHPGAREPRPPDAVSVSALFWNSLALSATKSIQDARWSLRVNPSSGNLHPTEGWLLLGEGGVLGDRAGPAVYHYAPREHALERRADLPPGAWDALTADLPPGAALLALSSIPWREAWKYGERAWRYCQHDAGHALAGLALAASLLGWRVTALPDVGDDPAATLLGLDRRDEQVPDEPEQPELLLLLETAPDPERPAPAAWTPPPDAVRAVAAATWHGRARALSPSGAVVDWPVIDEVTRACRKTPEWCQRTQLARPRPAPRHPRPRAADGDAPDAEAVLRTRRSAVAMDGRTGLTRDGLYDMLLRTLPEGAARPWESLPWETGVHLGLFVHRVADLDPGLYLLPRDPAAEPALRGACGGEYAWTPAPDTPPGLPLLRLETADVRAPAAGVSCGQDIAADGAFAVAMLADVGRALARGGAPAYRHLFWETGAVGQVLYLEARALGVSATGIGCFFDDPTHRLFGLAEGAGARFQSLYHFTVGGAVDDERLASEPPYPD